MYSGGSEITADGSKESDAKNGVVYKFYWMRSNKYILLDDPINTFYWMTQQIQSNVPAFSSISRS